VEGGIGEDQGRQPPIALGAHFLPHHDYARYPPPEDKEEWKAFLRDLLDKQESWRAYDPTLFAIRLREIRN
jgi:hypothetical protein